MRICRKGTMLQLLSVAATASRRKYGADALNYVVTPDGTTASSEGINSSSATRVYTLAGALSLAVAGDRVFLSDGTYHEGIETVTDGEEGAPILIVGGEGAVIRAKSPIVMVLHSWIVLKGFSVDGELDSTGEMESYANKCVVVDGGYGSLPLNGFLMQDMSVKNCGGECVRLKNFVTGATISNNDIRDCGIYDYRFNDGGENGEGIYIGTSSTQWVGPDLCNGNLVIANHIETSGNECVDIKEGSSGNVVEGNTCRGQLDADSGCFNCRGDQNTFRYNNALECWGTGVRLGGWEIDGYEFGQSNNVYGNRFVNAYTGAISVNTMPQGLICGNTCASGPCGITGDDDVGDIRETWDNACGDDTLIEANALASGAGRNAAGGVADDGGDTVDTVDSNDG